jgi:hypothetical protein
VPVYVDGWQAVEAPFTADGLHANELLPQGRLAQSMRLQATGDAAVYSEARRLLPTCGHPFTG